jgi:hypothetical protein
MSEQAGADEQHENAAWLHSAGDNTLAVGQEILESNGVKGAGNLSVIQTVMGPIGMALSAHEYADAVKKGDAQGAGGAAIDVLGGAAATTEGVSTLLAAGGLTGAEAVAEAAGPAGMVLMSGKMGYDAGTAMAELADSDATKTGLWGKDAGGNNQSAMDWGAGWGNWVDAHIGDKDPSHPSLAGGAAAAVGGIVGGIAGDVQAAFSPHVKSTEADWQEFFNTPTDEQKLANYVNQGQTMPTYADFMKATQGDTSSLLVSPPSSIVTPGPVGIPPMLKAP